MNVTDWEVDNLVQQLRGALERAMAMGFELPLFFAIISANGEIYAGCYESSASGPHLDCRMLVQHTPTGYLVAPINMMLVDRRGEAARVLIGGSTHPCLAG